MAVDYLNAFHIALGGSDVAEMLLSIPDDTLWGGHTLSWGLTVLLTMVMALSKATASVGLSLERPPWQLEARQDVALVWGDAADCLPPHLLRVYALPGAAMASARGDPSHRLLLHPRLTITWQGCGLDGSLSDLEAGVRALCHHPLRPA